MKSKIATTFGLALILGLGIFGTMLALGLFNTAPKVYANVGTATVTVTPSDARDIAQVTVQVTANTVISVGQRIFVKFASGTTREQEFGAAILSTISTFFFSLAMLIT